ncbi:MAG: hypothetical protein EAY72_11275 [Bacteroidetes bacterium]|nr:MAG: hypothetical protein EAY72_11275 [Bacteroidota bacterium]TAE70050.1 MAG: hypothetical protein EAY68_03165 [Bacteroidota bacterium]
MLEFLLIAVCLLYFPVFVYMLYRIISSAELSNRTKLLWSLVLFTLQPIGLLLCWVYLKVGKPTTVPSVSAL